MQNRCTIGWQKSVKDIFIKKMRKSNARKDRMDLDCPKGSAQTSFIKLWALGKLSYKFNLQ
jgi:hypothetical protein